MLAAASPPPAYEIILAVAGGVVTAAALAVVRWVRKAYHQVTAVTGTIEDFGKQWAAATALATVIRDNDADLEELKAMLMAAGRDPAWASVEAAVLQLHAGQQELQAGQQALADTLTAAAGSLDRVVERLEACA